MRSDIGRKTDIRRPGPWIIWVLILWFSPSSLDCGQKVSDLITSFRGQSIPVEEIRAQNDFVVAKIRYRQGDHLPVDKLEKDISTVFVKLADRYSGAGPVGVEVFMEDERISALEVDTKDALDFASGRIGLPDLMSRFRMLLTFNFDKRLASEFPKEEAVEDQAPSEPLLPEKIVEIPPDRIKKGMRAKEQGGGVAVPVTPALRPGTWPLAILVFLIAGSITLLIGIVLVRRHLGDSGLKIRARIDVYYTDGGRKSFTIDKEKTGIGRGGDNALVINDTSVSEHHAEIIAYESGFLLRDLGSSNGTFVNGERTSRTYLFAGDEIKLGATILKFSR